MISYLISLKSGISYIIYDNYAKSKTNPDDDLPLKRKNIDHHHHQFLLISHFLTKIKSSTI